MKLTGLFCLGIILFSLLFNCTWKLYVNSQKPVDAFLVLGGSINREFHVANLAKEFPSIPILVSQGSDEPCIWVIFKQENLSLKNVFRESCAKSTFENFIYSVPILLDWKVHKVKVITSGSHVYRAKLLAYIHLSSKGLATELEIAPEKGIPGNNESRLKTFLDVTRSLLWTIPSQIIHPHCSEVTRLDNIDLYYWRTNKFGCEQKHNLNFDLLPEGLKRN